MALSAKHRRNLLKLAAYLESLPEDYSHFNMQTYAGHRGDCDLPMMPMVYAARKPKEFLINCGTVACAVGHGPAAGIRMRLLDFSGSAGDWGRYSDQVFGTDDDNWPDREGPFEFLFGSGWKEIDNHHYGAAARIRYFLDTGDYDQEAAYAPYRKGSRSAKRRAIDNTSAEQVA